MHPVTPPRAVPSTHQKTRAVPYTPTTPFFKSSPQKVSKPPQQSLSPVKLRSTHLSTPNPTPRHRKKNSITSGMLLDDAFNFHSSTRTLFPPTPSTVGSGRTKDPTNVFRSPIKSRVQQSPTASADMFGLLESPEQPSTVTKRRLAFNIESDEEMVEDDVAVSTPKGKVISRDLARRWAEEIPNGETVEDEETFISASNSRNPFISNDRDTTKEFTLKKPSKPLDFIEFVNKKGDKFMKKAGTLDTFHEESHFVSKQTTQMATSPNQMGPASNLFGQLTKEAKKTSFQVYNDAE